MTSSSGASFETLGALTVLRATLVVRARTGARTPWIVPALSLPLIGLAFALSGAG
jgi:hypothetical protein